MKRDLNDGLFQGAGVVSGSGEAGASASRWGAAPSAPVEAVEPPLRSEGPGGGGGTGPFASLAGGKSVSSVEALRHSEP